MGKKKSLTKAAKGDIETSEDAKSGKVQKVHPASREERIKTRFKTGRWACTANRELKRRMMDLARTECVGKLARDGFDEGTSKVAQKKLDKMNMMKNSARRAEEVEVDSRHREQRKYRVVAWKAMNEKVTTLGCHKRKGTKEGETAARPREKKAMILVLPKRLRTKRATENDNWSKT